MIRNTFSRLTPFVLLFVLHLALSPETGQAGLFDFLIQKQAPSLRQDARWLNVRKPLSLEELRGSFVLLHFWNGGCVHCRNAVEPLKQLQKKYSPLLVVVGVHSAKYPYERDEAHVRHAVISSAITYPVLCDPQMRVWRDYGVETWPTFVLIDPRGKWVYRYEGEDVIPTLDKILANQMPKYTEDFVPVDLALDLARDKEPLFPLRYPGEVLADEAAQHLYIADSGHHRILITDPQGQVLETIGSGQSGRQDGSYAQARFDDPQGLAKSQDSLYVADRGNHVIRKIDLRQKTVSTIAGDGQRGRDKKFQGPALASRLNSPEDMILVGNEMYIAMTGLHQIWKMSLPTGLIVTFAGSGEEKLLDGPARRSAFARPSALARDEERLYVLDSDAGAVRSLPLNPNGQVKTLIGKGLFVYGDIDGPFQQALLQHPRGMAMSQNQLILADTYNHRIKAVDFRTQAVRTLAGSGEPGRRDGLLTQARFDAPRAVSVLQEKIYVADTNNHAIRMIDLGTRAVETLAIRFPDDPSVDLLDIKTSAHVIKIRSKHSRKIGHIHIQWERPVFQRLHRQRPSRARLYTEDGRVNLTYRLTGKQPSFRVDQTVSADKVFLAMEVTTALTRQPEKWQTHQVVYEIPLHEDLNGGDIALKLQLPDK